MVSYQTCVSMRSQGCNIKMIRDRDTATVKLLLQDVFYLQQRMMPVCDDSSVEMQRTSMRTVGQNYWMVVCRRPARLRLCEIGVYSSINAV